MTWSLNVTLDKETYSLHVAQKVAYALSPTLSILISQQGNALQLAVTPTEARIDGMFPTESYARTLITRSLNDFSLRAQIQLETQGLRELLASTALRESGL